MSAGEIWKLTIHYFLKIWQFQIFQAAGESIRVSNLVIALIFLLLGIRIIRLVLRLIANRLMPRMELTLSEKATINSVVYYTLFFLTLLFSLNIANIPLTVFTFFGGALAIGIGFGSQNVVNNFISGLILMIERPIKVGDIVEMDGLRGVIEHMGARSTRIRSFMNTHIVVPNSSFLEKNVVNWTLADTTVLIKVSVGVAYGSPTRLVQELIEKAIKAEPKALNEPEPKILFQEFGDNALMFDAFFAVSMKSHMERMIIESEMRFRIDDLFQKNNIVIAFPQRDVHLDSLHPLKIELMGTLPK